MILSSVCNAEASPNAPPAATLPASPNTPAVAQPTTPVTTQPITVSSDEAIRLLHTELERNSAIDAKEAYKDNAVSMWKALAIIVTMIGIIGTLVLAMMGYALFKDKKEYENAVKGAEKACEKAEQWEKKARNLCDEIDTLGKAKLVEMEKTIEQKAQAVLDSIDKKAEAKLKNIGERTQKSTQEIDAKAKKQMQITSLWSEALRLYNENKYEEACDKCAELVKLKPDMPQAYNIWGNALADWAKLTGNETLFKNAYSKYAKAVEIKPDYYDAYDNWSVSLLDWARIKIGMPEYEGLLKQAEEKCFKVESLKSGYAAYDLACIYALRGNKPECKKWLLAGQEAGTLEPKKHAMKDKDLKNVRDEAWFKEIKWKGEK
jgi:tetratricopeptide (TPR) repeat protein